MKKTIIISGAAGYGLNTLQFFFENALKLYGYNTFSYKNYMSRIRGGFNYTVITISDHSINLMEKKADVLVCLDENGYEIADSLKETGYILTYSSFSKGLENEIIVDENKGDEKIDSKALPMIALGSLLRFFDFPESFIDKISMPKWSEQINSSNQMAARLGYQNGKVLFSLDNCGQKSYMKVNGNQAVALGAMAADLRFFSAYPMAPSTGIMMTLSRYEREHLMAVEQVEDEIASIITALGASSNGARSMTATSGGGFSLMVEGLGFAGVAEVPIVIANVQRPGPATGLPTRTEQADLEFIARASQGEFPRMIIAPTSIEDCFYQTQRAFNMADKYQLPVIILTDQFLADSTTTVNKFDVTRIPVEKHWNLDKNGYKRYDYDNIFNGRKFPGLDDTLIMNDSHVHDEYGHVTEGIENTIKLKHRLMKKLELMEKELQEPEFIGNKSAKHVLIGWGSTVMALRDAIVELNNKGYEVGALLFTDVFPVPKKTISRLASEGAYFINVEQNYNNQFGRLLRAEAGISYNVSINKYDGRPITADDIVEKYEEVCHGKSV